MRFFIIFLSFCFGVLLFRWLLNNPKTQNHISKIDRFMSRIAAYLICLPFVIIPYAFLNSDDYNITTNLLVLGSILLIDLILSLLNRFLLKNMIGNEFKYVIYGFILFVVACALQVTEYNLAATLTFFVLGSCVEFKIYSFRNFKKTVFEWFNRLKKSVLHILASFLLVLLAYCLIPYIEAIESKILIPVAIGLVLSFTLLFIVIMFEKKKGGKIKNMKTSKHNLINNVCFWLFIISLLLLSAIILFAVYLYKIDIISSLGIKNLFENKDGTFDMGIFWTAIGAVGAILIGVFTVKNSISLYKLQKEQHDLTTIPRIMLKDISIKEDISISTNAAHTVYKTIEGIDYPYYSDTITPINSFGNLAMIVAEIINTSEAFSKVYLSNVTICKDGEKICEFNGSTFGFPNNTLFVDKHESGKIGLVVDKSVLSKISHSEMKIALFLRNNFDKTYIDTHTYCLLSICDDAVTVYPKKDPNNGLAEVK